MPKKRYYYQWTNPSIRPLCIFLIFYSIKNTITINYNIYYEKKNTDVVHYLLFFRINLNDNTQI